MRHSASALAILLLLSGCATFTSPRDNHVAQIRTVTCTITAQSQSELDDLEQLVLRANVDMVKIFGCRLEPRSKYVSTWLYSPDYNKSMQAMVDSLQSDEHDMVISYIRRPIQETVAMVAIPFYLTWEAVIDDVWRRLNITKKLDSWILMHEFGHALVLDGGHSAYGLMSPVAIGIMPGLPPARSWHVSESERQEIDRNRWRDFRSMIGTAKDAG